MDLPSILEFGWSSILYLILVFIFYKGLYHLIVLRKQEVQAKSLVPIGAMGLVFGFLGYIQKIDESVDAISAAGDISPALVATSISQSYSYPTLGLLCLAASYLFKYVNQ